MENNPYNSYDPYNQSTKIYPPGYQQTGNPPYPYPYERYGATPPSPASIYMPQRAGGQFQTQVPKPTPPKRAPAMPKAQALELVRWLKRGLVVASIVGFTALSALVASHITGVTANANNTAPSQFQPSQPAQQQGGNFFNQQGGSNFGSGNTPNSPQFPNAGTTVS